MRRVLSVLALALAVAVPAAVAADGDAKRAITKADQTRARGMVLRRADLGEGWKASPSSQSDQSALECDGYEVDESDLTITGDAESPEFTFTSPATGEFVFIGSMATVYKTARQAAASWSRGVKPGLAKCLQTILERSAGGGSTKLRIVSASRLALPRVAPRQAAYRLVGELTGPGGSIRMVVDLILVGHDRALGGVFVASLARPMAPADLRGLSALVAGRMAKAFAKRPTKPTA